MVIEAAAAKNIVVAQDNYAKKQPAVLKEPHVDAAFKVYAATSAGTSSRPEDPGVRQNLVLREHPKSGQSRMESQPYNKPKRTNYGASKRSYTAGYRAALEKLNQGRQESQGLDLTK